MGGHARIFREGLPALGARVASKERVAMLGVVRTSPGSPSPRGPKGQIEENKGRANARLKILVYICIYIADPDV